MGKPKNFADWSESDFDSSNRPRSSSVEFWNENYVAPARKYRERYRRMTQEEKKREWRSYPDPLPNPGCPYYCFGWAQDPSLTEAQEAQTESSDDAVENNSYIDLMIETAPSDAIRLQLNEERNKLMFGVFVEDYLKDIQELYSPDTTIDTSLYQYRMPQLPDSMLSPFLQGGWEWDYETFRSTQEYLREREEIIAQLEAQAQHEESLVLQPDATDVTGGRIPRIAPSREELNRILQQEQQALENILRSTWPEPVPTLEAAPNVPLGESLREYFLREGPPGEKAIYLIERCGVSGRESIIQYGIKQDFGFSIGSGKTTYFEEQRLMTDEQYALEFLRDAVEYRSDSWVGEIQYYLKQVEEWKKLYGDKPLPRSRDLYNYVPPKKEAFDVASLGTLKENLYSDEFFAGQGDAWAMDNGTFGISDSTPDEGSLYRNQDSVGEPGCTQAPNSTVEIESVNNVKLSLDEFERMFLKISKQESQTAIC